MITFEPWDVLHVNVDEVLPALLPKPGVGGYFVVFWSQGVPLGHQEVPAARLPVPPGHLAALAAQAIAPAVGDYLLEHGFRAPLPVTARHRMRDAPPDFQEVVALGHPLARLHERIRQASKHVPERTVSVVICTRDRAEALERCLYALRCASLRPHEIVVVDNAPKTDATRQIVERMPDVRYVAEPRPGLSVARNTGIRNTTGEVVAFTDDDVVVHPDWLTRLVQGFERPEVWAVTGLILPAELQTEAQLVFQRGQGSYGWGYRTLTFGADFFERMRYRGVPVWHIGAGANMAFRRCAFERVGGFDERLGVGAAGCSEDSELWYRILAEGGQCRYVPGAVVHHYHRRSSAELRHQMFHYMRGHVAALLWQFEKYRHWGNLYRAFVILPGYYARLLMRRFRRTAPMKPDTLSEQIRGCLAGLKYYVQHRRSPPYSNSQNNVQHAENEAPFLMVSE